jgi:hypothetical protein
VECARTLQGEAAARKIGQHWSFAAGMMDGRFDPETLTLDEPRPPQKAALRPWGAKITAAPKEVG